MLLHGLRCLDQLADESKQFCAQSRVFFDVNTFVRYVELGEKWEENLNPAYRIEGAVDGMGHHSFDVLLKV